MKTMKHMIHLAGFAGMFGAMASLAADAPATNAPAESPATTKVAAAAPPDQVASITPTVAATSPVVPTADKPVVLNFRGAPLEMVLNYLSTAAGFIINPEVELKGTVDVWSNQPLSKEDAVHVLQKVLDKNGYVVNEHEGILTITSHDKARSENIPVHMGNNPAAIPDNNQVVTQIIPIRSLNAMQLPKDLAPLLPSDTQLTANESGNALVMTDTQSNIRRITEIVKALDSVNSGINSIHTFPLKYADAKALVNVIKELFPSPNGAQPGGNFGGGFGRFRAALAGGFNPFGGGPPGGGNGGSDTGSGHTPTARVLAVSDDHSNSLIVSAPDDLMPSIDELVKSVDQPVEDIAEVRTFHLKNSDPTDMAELLASLFPDDSNSTDASRTASQFQFRGPFGPFGPGGFRQGNNATSSDTSDRMKRMAKVIAVPDKRTASVVVSASKDLMPQIASMIEDLDTNTANNQHVHIVQLKNADVYDVASSLQDLFPRGVTSSQNANSLMSSQNNNALDQRAKTMNQQMNNSSSTTSTGFGTPGSGRGGL